MIHLSRSSVSLDSTLLPTTLTGQLDPPFSLNRRQAEPKVGVVEAGPGREGLHLHHLLYLGLVIGDVEGGGGEGLGQCEVKRGVLNHPIMFVVSSDRGTVFFSIIRFS